MSVCVCEMRPSVHVCPPASNYACVCFKSSNKLLGANLAK